MSWAMAENARGELCAAEGQPTKAIEAHTAALKVLRALLGEGHMEVAVTAAAIGQLYLRQSSFVEAEAALSQALGILRAEHGEWHPRVRAVQELALAAQRGIVTQREARPHHALRADIR